MTDIGAENILTFLARNGEYPCHTVQRKSGCSDTEFAAAISALRCRGAVETDRHGFVFLTPAGAPLARGVASGAFTIGLEAGSTA